MSRTGLNRRVLHIGAGLLAVAAFAAGLLNDPPAWAEGGRYFPPAPDAVVMKECSACHVAFPPGMLPARSWHKLMAGLNNHFGENASLDPATVQHINNVLVANAADTGGRRSGAMRGLGKDDTPLRITETPWWIRAHRGEVRPAAFKDPRVGSKSNCVACHRDAAQGVFEDE